MKLEVLPVGTRCHPLGGFFWPSLAIEGLLDQLVLMDLYLEQVAIYALPEKENPAHQWGWFVQFQLPVRDQHLEQVIPALLAYEQVYLPDFSTLKPPLFPKDFNALFGQDTVVFHPQTGWVALMHPIDVMQCIEMPLEVAVNVQKTTHPLEPKHTVQSFKVVQVTEVDVEQSLRQSVLNKKGEVPKGPLSNKEKARLKIYEQLYKGGVDEAGNPIGINNFFKNRLMEFARLLGAPDDADHASWQKDQQDLEDRNKSELDRLLKMLEDDPEEGIKYAIPFDLPGLNTGKIISGLFNLEKRWDNFSLFNSGSAGNRGGGGGYINLGEDRSFRLQQQYHKTAEALAEKGLYEKAAYVYLKLLKHPEKAYQMLEKGHCYVEAGQIALKYLKNKRLAAELYVKGQLLDKAIELYIELEDFLSAARVAQKMGAHLKARQLFQKAITRLVKNGKLKEAAWIQYRELEDYPAAKATLLTGWVNYRKPQVCLTEYWEMASLEGKLLSAVQEIHQGSLKAENSEIFMAVLGTVYKKHDGEQKPVYREIAYDTISRFADFKPNLVSWLKNFNPKDAAIKKDITRHQIKQQKK
ncbi:MAG: hypothetical protein AAFV80_16960 [Bacteroidota bacterium]